MLGSTTPATATRRVVADGLADWVSVVNDRGNAVSSSGQLPSGLITQPWSDCAAGEAGGPALTTELQVVVADTPELSAIRTAEAVDTAYLDDLRSRLGFTADVALLLDGRRGREHVRPVDRSVGCSRPCGKRTGRRWCGQ